MLGTGRKSHGNPFRRHLPTAIFLTPFFLIKITNEKLGAFPDFRGWNMCDYLQEWICRLQKKGIQPNFFSIRFVLTQLCISNQPTHSPPFLQFAFFSRFVLINWDFYYYLYSYLIGTLQESLIILQSKIKLKAWECHIYCPGYSVKIEKNAVWCQNAIVDWRQY